MKPSGRRRPAHPGVILKHHHLEPLKMTEIEFAEISEISLTIISGLVNESINIDADIAFKLSRILETSAEFWINLQNNYDRF